MNLHDLVTNKTFTLTQVDQYSADRGREYSLRRLYRQYRGDYVEPEDPVLDLHDADAEPGNRRATFSPPARQLQHSAEHCLEQRNGGRDDLLHHQRNHAHDGILGLQERDHGGYGYNNHRGNRRRQRNLAKRRGHGKYVVGSAASTPINFASGFASKTGLSLMDAATVTNDVLQITLAGSATDKGSAWFTKPVT